MVRIATMTFASEYDHNKSPGYPERIDPDLPCVLLPIVTSPPRVQSRRLQRQTTVGFD